MIWAGICLRRRRRRRRFRRDENFLRTLYASDTSSGKRRRQLFRHSLTFTIIFTTTSNGSKRVKENHKIQTRTYQFFSIRHD